MSRRRQPLAHFAIEYEPAADSSLAEALCWALEVQLGTLPVSAVPTVGGLIGYALSNVRVAREALELRRRWSAPPQTGP